MQALAVISRLGLARGFLLRRLCGLAFEMLGILACRIRLSALHLKSLVHLTNVTCRICRNVFQGPWGAHHQVWAHFFSESKLLAAWLWLNMRNLQQFSARELAKMSYALARLRFLAQSFLNGTGRSVPVLWQGDP